MSDPLNEPANFSDPVLQQINHFQQFGPSTGDWVIVVTYIVMSLGQYLVLSTRDLNHSFGP